MSRRILERIHGHGAQTYPEEDAGFLLGADGTERVVADTVELKNTREADARRTRYLIGPEQYRRAEMEAEARKLEVIGIFHSHPDHPARPSEADRAAAWSGLSYVIVAVESTGGEGKKIVHVHAKDERIDHDKLYDTGGLGLGWHTAKLPGLGDVNWTAFFSALSDTGYRGPVCIEVEDRAYEGSLEDRKRSLRQSKRFLEQFMA